MGLHQVLKKGASYVDLLFGRKDMADENFVSFLILTFTFYLSFILYLLYLHCGVGERASIADSDLADLQVLGLSF